MTLVNWISISIAIVIFIVGTLLCIYYIRKLRNLDGFMGIISPKRDEKGRKRDK